MAEGLIIVGFIYLILAVLTNKIQPKNDGKKDGKNYSDIDFKRKSAVFKPKIQHPNFINRLND